jgi:hypothetical protein
MAKVVAWPSTPPEPKRRTSISSSVFRIVTGHWEELSPRLKVLQDEDSISGSWRDDYAVAASEIKRIGTEEGDQTIINAKEREIKATISPVLERMELSRKERLIALNAPDPDTPPEGDTSTA